MNRHLTGTEYEQKAVRYLQQCGYRILEKNYRSRTGEIDLIARDGAYLVFVEVKFRRNFRLGEGLEAVNWQKQQRIIRTARCYLQSHGGEDQPCRFDVVSFLGEQVTLQQDAFWLG